MDIVIEKNNTFEITLESKILLRMRVVDGFLINNSHSNIIPNIISLRK